MKIRLIWIDTWISLYWGCICCTIKQYPWKIIMDDKFFEKIIVNLEFTFVDDLW